MELKDFYEKLEKHDWYYNFSDDHRYYSSGRKEEQVINGIAEESPAHKELLKAFAEHMFSGEPWGTEKAPKPKLEDFITHK